MNADVVEKYNQIIRDISGMENVDSDNNPWYSEEYNCPALDKLEKIFPNINFSKHDLLKLRGYAKNKKDNDNVIYDLSDSKYGHSFEESHGHMKTKEEREKENKAKESKEMIDEEYNNAFSTFFYVCEELNDEEKIKEPSYKIEENIFEPVYNYKFEITSKDSIIMNYYDRYREYRELKNENEKIKKENIDLNSEFNNLKIANKKILSENEELKENITSLRQKLTRTIDFCIHVKESIFGKFFFGKQLKSLPSAEADKNDIER